MSAHHLWIDASAGIAGDMLLGALHDAGARLDRIQDAVDAVVPGAVRITATEVRRAGLRACKIDVAVTGDDQPHRTWREIRALLEPAPPRAAAVFARLAAAEAAVHGIDAEDVHFHEVGALDAIADVVGVCAALDDLGAATVSVGEVAVGSGSVRSGHGVLPVPVPAVVELSRGWRIRAGGTGELATPTGMALLCALTATCEDLPAMRLEAVGVGAGDRDTPERANIVRVLLGERAALPPAPQARLAQPHETASARTPHTPATDTQMPQPTAINTGRPQQARRDVGPSGVEDAPELAADEAAVLLEANIDDLDPRLWPGVLAALLAVGADDAWLVPIVMKKGRPAHTLTALCAPGAVQAVRERIFRDTSTLGVRASDRRKTALRRTVAEIVLAGVTVRIKIGHAGGVVVQVMPEFDDVAALAAELGIAERVALTRAVADAADAGIVVGRRLRDLTESLGGTDDRAGRDEGATGDVARPGHIRWG